MYARQALIETGKNLQEVRVEKGLSVATLAILSGVAEEIIMDMEQGRFDFPMEIVFDLAETMNVDFRRVLVDTSLTAGKKVK